MISIHGGIDEALHVRWWGTEALPPRFSDWLEVFKLYDGTHFDFYEKTTDLAWWYTERPNISILAGAVWRAGGLAFEEFVGKKDRGKGKYSGRFDALFSLEDRTFVAEAKHHWLALRSKDRTGVIKAQAKLARKDMRALKKYKGHDYRMALVFTSPTFPSQWADKMPPKLIEHRKDGYAAVRGLFDMGFRVDLYPETELYAEYEGGFNSKGKLHPGITLHMGIEPVPQ